MAASILNIGQTGLIAAQAAINTTGHNIANSATPGYNRQQVIQTTGGGQNFGFGFVGKGTQVADVTRIYSDFLAHQVITTQTAKSQIDTYSSLISQIDNQFADASSGLSPALQNFFNGVQDVASNPDSTPSRQSALSAAQSLTSRFQSLDGQLRELRAGVNSQLTTTIDAINIDAAQISSLNQAIQTQQGTSGVHAANDLLDQRDQVISDLSKLVAVSVVKDGNSYSVFIGNGQPLVVRSQAFKLVATTSATDLSRTEVGYATNGVVNELPETALSGGTLGGLFDFRANTLDVAQNSLGRVATVLAMTFNAQHMLGQDQNGALGGNFFNAAPPLVKPNVANAGPAVMTATISNASNLTISDYDLQVMAGTVPGPASYKLTRLSDGVTSVFATFPQTIDGVDFNMTAGTQVTGDEFLIQPTVNGASGFGVAITDTRKIAAAAPVRTSAPATNTGSGVIGPAAVTSTAMMPMLPVSLAYTAGPLGTPGTLTGFPVSMFPVTVTLAGGVAIPPYLANPVNYVPGATISFGGVSFALSGSPNTGDTFTVASNPGGVGDNRNALLLAGLQTANTIGQSTTTYQGAYAQLVGLVGNKTRELQVNGAAENAMLAEAQQSQQSLSGVNLDEEAANLMRYQQAYQASGKIMQTANILFDTILNLRP